MTRSFSSLAPFVPLLALVLDAGCSARSATADGEVIRPDGSACPPGLVICGGACVDVATDENHCGGCGMNCDPGAVCTSGTCSCPPGTMDCGNGCTTGFTRDPQNCGMPGNSCGDTEYCVAGSCVCRPPLVSMGGGCVDPTTNPDACGAASAACSGGTPLCAGGVCVAACPDGTNMCAGGCVDFQTDPRNCGGCGDGCDVEQICSSGRCRDFRTAAGCTTCPCTACSGDFATCCTYPGTTDAICVDGDCP